MAPSNDPRRTAIELDAIREALEYAEIYAESWDEWVAIVDTNLEQLLLASE